jgi:hypothetical protein
MLYVSIDGFANWTFMNGDVSGWTIDTQETVVEHELTLPPADSFDPSDSGFCFGTNHFPCTKEQTINLWELGFTPPVMRACVPFVITWSEE